MATSKFITGNALLNILKDRGLIDEKTRRVVIDIEASKPPVMFIETYGGHDLFVELITALEESPVPELPKVVTECRCGHHLRQHIPVTDDGDTVRGECLLGVCPCQKYAVPTDATDTEVTEQ